MATKTVKLPDGSYTTYDDSSYIPNPQAPTGKTVNDPTIVQGPTTPVNPNANYYTPSALQLPTSITSRDLQSEPLMSVNEPADTAPYPVAGLNAEPSEPATTLTPGEADVQKRIEDIMGLNTALTGEGGYHAQQEDAQGIGDKQKTQSDLSARLKALQNEALQIPLQLQQDAEGRGMTRGGLRPLEVGALRKNAIQALGVSSLLEASRGNLTMALDLVDRAVKQKYDPIRAEIDAKLKNLDLILKSPQYTADQKKKAQVLKDAEDKKRAAADAAAAAAKEIGTIAANAAKNGADPTTLQQIHSAQSSEEALQIAAAAGFATDPLKRRKDELENIKTQKEIDKLTKDINKKSADEEFTVKLTPEDTRNLVGAGFTPTEIRNIQRDVNEHGIEAVLEGITDPAQKKAIEKAYGKKSKVTRAQVEETVTLKVAQDALKATYTEDELKQLAIDNGFASFWKSRDQEVKDFLNSEKARELYIELLYKQYQDAGMAE